MAWNFIPGALLRDPDFAERVGKALNEHFAEVDELVEDNEGADAPADQESATADPERSNQELLAELYGHAIRPYLPEEVDYHDGDR